MTVARRASALGTALFAVSLVLVLAGSKADGLRTMAAIGDSLTVALRSCPAADCRANSWSTGTSPAVNSHLLRLRGAQPALAGYDFAVSGRKVADLDRQAAQAASVGAQYVTVLVGTNDVCRESLAAMTPVATFRAQIAQAMSTLSSRVPAAEIFVASIPDPERLRALFAGNATARARWAADGPTGTCGVFLQNPTSDAPADAQRRAAAHQRLADLNATLAEICALHPRCVYDGGAVAAWDFAARDVSTIDYFHFSATGQASLAALTYPLAFPAPEVAPPPPEQIPPAPPPATAPVRRLSSKLKLRRASIRGGRLRVELTMTGRATGRIGLSYEAGGRPVSFAANLGSSRAGEKDVHAVLALDGAERGRRTGTLRVAYAGSARVRGDALRSRVAAADSRLRLGSASLTGTRLRLRGTIAAAVSGHVRLRVTYARPDGTLAAWRHRAAIRAGRWSADEGLPAEAIADPGAYLTFRFTGDRAARGGPYAGAQDGRVLATL
jgi:lysophospholipase L1-like esterase